MEVGGVRILSEPRLPKPGVLRRQGLRVLEIPRRRRLRVLGIQGCREVFP